MSIILEAARAVQRVVDLGESLDKVLPKGMTHWQVARHETRSEVWELVMGSCRYYFYLKALLNQLLAKPIKDKDRILHFMLICALYQIVYMQTPDHAVVNEVVQAVKKLKQHWATKFVNGVLRNFLRKQRELLAVCFTPAEMAAVPEHLFRRVKQDWDEDAASIFQAYNEKPPLVLRVNKLKTSRDEYIKLLEEAGISCQRTQTSMFGVVLDKPVSVQNIPNFFQGWASVQDESAQLILNCMQLQPGQNVLDGCAAPGGKSGLLLESQPDVANMVLVDLPDRVSRIHENLRRLELKARVIGEDLLTSDRWQEFSPYDQILMDVPCSGSGVIRRHPDIKHRRREQDIRRFAEQQLSLLNKVWPELKVGGQLLYVTCSIFKQENDAVIDQFIKAHANIEFKSIGDEFGIKTQYGRQLLPKRQSGDGFYYCAMVKCS